MLNFTENDRTFLQENFGKCTPLLNANSPREVLIAIYDLIEEKGFAPPHYDEYNDFGREAQRIYDSIYLNNP